MMTIHDPRTAYQLFLACLPHSSDIPDSPTVRAIFLAQSNLGSSWASTSSPGQPSPPGGGPPAVTPTTDAASTPGARTDSENMDDDPSVDPDGDPTARVSVPQRTRLSALVGWVFGLRFFDKGFWKFLS